MDGLYSIFFIRIQSAGELLQIENSLDLLL